MKKVWLLLFAILLSTNLISQEFRISVSVNSSQIQGTDKTVFQNIQELLNEFINQRSWTNKTYEEFALEMR